MFKLRKNPLLILDTSAEPVGLRLTKILMAKSLPQVAIAYRIGIPQYLISDCATGRLHLSDDILISFALALGTSADAILGLSGLEIGTPILKLVKRLKKIEALPAPKQKALLQTIDGFLKGEGM